MGKAPMLNHTVGFRLLLFFSNYSVLIKKTPVFRLLGGRANGSTDFL